MEGDGDMEFDTRSEASSDHKLSDDEPSMSDASRTSSISRESSGQCSLMYAYFLPFVTTDIYPCTKKQKNKKRKT